MKQDDDLNGRAGDVDIKITPLPDGDYAFEISTRIALPVVIGFIILCVAVVFYVLR